VGTNSHSLTGIAHSEQNESNDWVHFLQIWATPWSRGLTPRYHTQTFSEAAKREAFVPILSPLAAGPLATTEQERSDVPSLEGTIPIHADLVMAAGLIGKGKKFEWGVGGTDGKPEGLVRKKQGRDAAVLEEGDGAYVEGVKVGDKLEFESVGEAEAEVVVLDSD